MEKTFEHRDKLTGLVTDTFLDPLTNRFVIRHRQDLERQIEMTRAMRNDDDYWKQGVKKGFAHAAHIPDVVIVELKQIGVDVFRAPAREIIAGLKKINKEHLITTTKRVA